MQPQANITPQKGPGDIEKIAPELMGSSELEQKNRGQANQSSDNDGIREEAVSDESNACLVTFGPDDIENPLNWSTKLKWGVTAAISGTGFLRIMVSTVRHSLYFDRILYHECGHSFETWNIY
jgi:hypothetical protein